jgi:UDP-2-acetamido-3-amino-2,3-dideoxy-glucuronate N-acetyltransferase
MNPEALSMIDPSARVHPTSDVSPEADVGAGTSIWNRAQVRERARIGRGCIIGKDVYIDAGVTIGDHVKIQNSALVYHGATLEDGVFLGPQAVLTNDLYPRAITADGTLKSSGDWTVGPILVRYGASVGAGAVILPNVTLGRFAMVAAGAVVTEDVPDHALVMGVPARVAGFVCTCGRRMVQAEAEFRCPQDGWTYRPGVPR